APIPSCSRGGRSRCVSCNTSATRPTASPSIIIICSARSARWGRTNDRPAVGMPGLEILDRSRYPGDGSRDDPNPTSSTHRRRTQTGDRPESMILISANDLGRQYSGDPIFQGLAFEVRAGERIGLVGPNGAGKTTLMQLLAGNDQPDYGNLYTRPGIRVSLL